MLKSTLLSDNQRLQQASNGPPSIRKRPPDDDAGAVQRIQKALSQFGYSLPKSFPNGPNMEPDGLYGPETEKAVRDFQKAEFPGKISEWDGRCGPNTLEKMDARLDAGPVPDKPIIGLPSFGKSATNCKTVAPGNTPTPKPAIVAKPIKLAGTGARRTVGTPWMKMARKLKKKHG